MAVLLVNYRFAAFYDIYRTRCSKNMVTAFHGEYS